MIKKCLQYPFHSYFFLSFVCVCVCVERGYFSRNKKINMTSSNYIECKTWFLWNKVSDLSFVNGKLWGLPHTQGNNVNSQVVTHIVVVQKRKQIWKCLSVFLLQCRIFRWDYFSLWNFMVVCIFNLRAAFAHSLYSSPLFHYFHVFLSSIHYVLALA